MKPSRETKRALGALLEAAPVVGRARAQSLLMRLLVETYFDGERAARVANGERLDDVECDFDERRRSFEGVVS